MPDFIASARAGTVGTAQIFVQHSKSGIEWIVSLIGVDSNPRRSAATATLKRNGQFITNTAQLPASAQGKPFYRLTASDSLTIDFTNLTNGDIALATISYEEYRWGIQGSGDIV